MRNGRFRFIGRAALALGGAAPVLCLAAAALAASRSEMPPRPQFRFLGAVIRVTDMERALDFYSGKMGFAVVSDGGAPRTVRLGGDFPLWLRLVPGAAGQSETDVSSGAARAVISFMTADIAARSAAWRKAGIAFLEDAPHRVGVGMSIPFRDPFGTAHSLLQQTVAPPEPFAEPKVYNSGFYHADVAAMRPLYVETLGFVVRTERYFPPALPLGHADGSFGFMLHERKDLAPAAASYPDGPGTTIVFETGNVDAAVAWLKARGVEVFRPEGAAAAGIAAFRDGAGVVSEIWPAPPRGPSLRR